MAASRALALERLSQECSKAYGTTVADCFVAPTAVARLRDALRHALLQPPFPVRQRWCAAGIHDSSSSSNMSLSQLYRERVEGPFAVPSAAAYRRLYESTLEVVLTTYGRHFTDELACCDVALEFVNEPDNPGRAWCVPADADEPRSAAVGDTSAAGAAASAPGRPTTRMCVNEARWRGCVLTRLQQLVAHEAAHHVQLAVRYHRKLKEAVNPFGCEYLPRFPRTELERSWLLEGGAEVAVGLVYPFRARAKHLAEHLLPALEAVSPSAATPPAGTEAAASTAAPRPSMEAPFGDAASWLVGVEMLRASLAWREVLPVAGHALLALDALGPDAKEAPTSDRDRAPGRELRQLPPDVIVRLEAELQESALVTPGGVGHPDVPFLLRYGPAHVATYAWGCEQQRRHIHAVADVLLGDHVGG